MKKKQKKINTGRKNKFKTIIYAKSVFRRQHLEYNFNTHMDVCLYIFQTCQKPKQIHRSTGQMKFICIKRNTATTFVYGFTGIHSRRTAQNEQFCF